MPEELTPLPVEAAAYGLGCNADLRDGDLLFTAEQMRAYALENRRAQPEPDTVTERILDRIRNTLVVEGESAEKLRHSIELRVRDLLMEIHPEAQPEPTSITGIGTDKPRDVYPTSYSPEVAAQADGSLAAQPEPASPAESFCYCNDGISLQSVSGGAHKAGYAGEVFLKVEGEYVRYIKADPAPSVAPEPPKEKIAPVQGWPQGIPWSLHLEAYAAYCKRWSPQPALIDLEGRGCRGGFGVQELDEFIPGWRDKVSEIGKLRVEVSELRSQLAANPPRAPLTPTEIYKMWVAATIEQPSPENCYMRGVIDAERDHGIRGQG
jgi:hypothetical protein